MNNPTDTVATILTLHTNHDPNHIHDLANTITNAIHPTITADALEYATNEIQQYTNITDAIAWMRGAAQGCRNTTEENA